MNREDRRKYAKKLRADGKSPEQIEQIIAMKKAMEIQKLLPEGQAVKLNIEQIKSHPGWENMRVTYKAFVESNVDTAFTVEYEERHKGKGIVCLKEDTSIPKWNFWVGDLISLPKEAVI